MRALRDEARPDDVKRLRGDGCYATGEAAAREVRDGAETRVGAEDRGEALPHVTRQHLERHELKTRRDVT